jgi:hypothetical protein
MSTHAPTINPPKGLYIKLGVSGYWERNALIPAFCVSATNRPRSKRLYQVIGKRCERFGWVRDRMKGLRRGT